jgi:hypothetical protein
MAWAAAGAGWARAAVTAPPSGSSTGSTAGWSVASDPLTTAHADGSAVPEWFGALAGTLNATSAARTMMTATGGPETGRLTARRWWAGGA